MVSAKSLFFFAAMAATAVMAAPAPVAGPKALANVHVSSLISEREYNELVDRAVEVYAASSIETRGISDLIGSLISITGNVIALIAGTIAATKKDSPGTPEAIAFLSTTFSNLNEGLLGLIESLKTMPVIGPIISLLGPVLISPLVLSLTRTLQRILNLIIKNAANKAALAPVFQEAIPNLLQTVSTLTSTLSSDSPLMKGQLSKLDSVASEITSTLSSLNSTQ